MEKDKLLVLNVDVLGTIKKIKMANNWVKLEVYSNSNYLGSFYADVWSKQEIIAAINKEYGIGNWTKYNIGN